jgi:hypothetical protein
VIVENFDAATVATLPDELAAVLAKLGDPKLADEILRDIVNKMKLHLAGESSGWHWRTLANAYELKPPRRWLVTGMLPIPSLVTLYGPPGTLKTMLAQDWAVCVAGGKAWLAPLPGDGQVQGFPTEMGPVLWIDVDNGLDRTERRLGSIARAHKVPETAPLHYVSFPVPPFFANDPASVDRLVEEVLAIGAKLVVIDNLGTITGGADENSSQMVAVMAGLRQVAERCHCVVIVIHHKSKGTRDRVGDSLRGHSSIEAAVDLALLVERDDDGITIRSTKTRDVPVEPFGALWTYDQDSDGELVTGRFFGTGRPVGAKQGKTEEAKLCIMKDMRDGMNQTELTDLVKNNAGIGRQSALAAVKNLTESGKLHAREGKKANELLYYRA